MRKCPCNIKCISYAICKHKTFDDLVHGCDAVDTFIHPKDVLSNERCRMLSKTIQSTEWEIKIIGERNTYEVLRGRYRGPNSPLRSPDEQWEWLRILDIQYNTNPEKEFILNEH